MTDQHIITILKENSIKDSEQVLNHVYKTYYIMIEGFVLQNNGTQDDAQDVFQDTVMSLYRNVKNGKYSPDSKLSTYLFSIGKNIWFKKLRKNGRLSHFEESEHYNISSDDDIQGTIEYTEHQKLIGRLLHKVGEECNNLLKLFYFEKMRMVKIATVLDYSSEQVAKNKKNKCMKKLRAVVLSNDNLKEQLRNNY